MFLTKHVKVRPLFWVENPVEAEQFRAKGWVEASPEEVAAYTKETPFTDGLPYPGPYVEPADQEQGPFFPGGKEQA